MDKSNLKIGQILEVKTSKNVHYEKVIQIENEILTETLQEWEDDETSIQGLLESEKVQYRIIPDYEIYKALKRKQIVLTDAHCICQYDQYGGATNPKCLLHGDGQ